MPIPVALRREVRPSPVISLCEALLLQLVQHVPEEDARIGLLARHAVKLHDCSEDLVVRMGPQALTIQSIPEVGALLGVNLQSPSLWEPPQ